MEELKKYNELEKVMKGYVPHVRNGRLTFKDFQDITEVKREELIEGDKKERLFEQPTKVGGYVFARKREWKGQTVDDVYDILYVEKNGREVFLRKIDLSQIENSGNFLMNEVNSATDIFDAGVYRGQEVFKNSLIENGVL